MNVEKRLFKRKQPGILWVVVCLLLPIPLLFHRYFLQDVVWELVLFGL